MCFLCVLGACNYITARRKRQSKSVPPPKSNKWWHNVVTQVLVLASRFPWTPETGCDSVCVNDGISDSCPLKAYLHSYLHRLVPQANVTIWKSAQTGNHSVDSHHWVALCHAERSLFGGIRLVNVKRSWWDSKNSLKIDKLYRDFKHTQTLNLHGSSFTWSTWWHCMSSPSPVTSASVLTQISEARSPPRNSSAILPLLIITLMWFSWETCQGQSRDVPAHSEI